MTDRGAPYMIMEKMTAAYPHKSFLLYSWRARMETKAMVANKASTERKSPKTLAFSFFGAKVRKMMTYIISSPAPVPFMIDTSMLFADMNGNPYLFQTYT